MAKNHQIERFSRPPSEVLDNRKCNLVFYNMHCRSRYVKFSKIGCLQFLTDLSQRSLLRD